MVLHVSYIETNEDESINAKSVILKVENFKYDRESMNSLWKELVDPYFNVSLVITGVVELKDEIDSSDLKKIVLRK